MFTLPPLPYAENALDPVISANTLSFLLAHHKAYVDNLNNLAKGTSTNPLHSKVIRETAGKADKVGLFNNPAQCGTTRSTGTPQGGRRWEADRPHRPDDRLRSRRLRHVQEGIRKRLRHAVRLRLGLARGRGAQDREDVECGAAVHQGRNTAADDRRLGACVLSRLPEPPPGLRQRRHRPVAELEFRGGEPVARPIATHGFRTRTRSGCSTGRLDGGCAQTLRRGRAYAVRRLVRWGTGGR